MPAILNERGTGMALLWLRFTVGASLAGLHGFSKLGAAAQFFLAGQSWGFVNAVESLGFPWPVLFAVAAALAESVAAVFLAVGLFTRVSAGLVGFTMAVAVFRHLRANESGELAWLYLAAAVTICVAGGGAWTLDSWLRTGGKPRLQARADTASM